MIKRIIQRDWSWLLFFSFFLIVNCQTVAPPETKDDSAYSLTLAPATGYISIQAKKASLFEIIRELKEKHQIEVILPNVSEDRIISVDIVDKPLHEGLAALIPKDLKYRFSTKDIETVIPGSAGDKKAPVTQIRKSKNLPVKDKTTPLSPQQKIIVKSKPVASMTEKYTEGERGTKIHPSRSKGGIGKGGKIPKKSVPDGYRYARLNLFIDADNNIRIEQILEIEGRLIESETYNGRFLYAAYVDNKIVAAGSMQDPLLVRSLGEQPGRLTTRAKKGYFSISLPDVFLDKSKLAQGKVDFYLLKDDAGMPEEITPKTFLKIKRRLETTTSIGSEELLKSFLQNQKEGVK